MEHFQDESRKLNPAERLLWPGRASPSAPQLLAQWVKAQHEGALPPPSIVRKDPRVPHTA